MNLPLIRFRRSFCLLAVLALALGATFPSSLFAGSEAPKPSAAATLEPDASIRFGKLDNGVRYAVLHNEQPKGRASLRLTVKAGSFDETEEQRGLAHFLEHMAFNGSKRYAPGTLVEFFQRMGMSFGGDTNAYTSFDHTQYELELADTSENALHEGLKVLADVGGGLLLEPSKIEKERDIILSEKRARDTLQMRAWTARTHFMMPGTLAETRVPIGLETVIREAKRERFLDFYDTWYRPENLIVVAVGDFSDEKMEQLIRTEFAPLAPRAPARPRADFGDFDTSPGVRAAYHRDADATTVSLGISAIARIDKLPDTAANRLRDLALNAACSIVNKRLAEILNGGNAPYLGAQLGFSEEHDRVREVFLSVSAKPEQWKEAFARADQELRRALQYGFGADELREVVLNSIQGLELAVKAAPTRQSAGLSEALAGALREEVVFTTAEADLALFKPAFEKLSTEECRQALRKAWAEPNRRIFLSGNLALPAADAEKQLMAAYEEAEKTPVTARELQAGATWDYTRFGDAGKVTERRHIEDLDLTLVRFENGVRLNLKKTPFDAGSIGISVRVGFGSLTEPADKQGLAQLAAAVYDRGGLGRLSIDELRSALAGRNGGVGFGLAPDAFVLSGGATPEDLELALQMAAAKITDPGYRPEALVVARKGIEEMFLGLQHSLTAPLSTEVAGLLAGGDRRFGLPPKEKLLSLTLDDVRTWLGPQLGTGPIEVGLIGDLDIETAIAAVSRTLGALPARQEGSIDPALLKVNTPEKPFERRYEVDTSLPKGVVALFWKTNDSFDASRARRLTVLASVFSDRLRVKLREEMGDTYSPNASSEASLTIPGYGYISTMIDVAPALADKVAEAAIGVADEMARNGLSEDEIQRSLQPLLTSARASVRTNGYWLGAVVSQAQSKPRVLDWARTRLPDLEAIRKPELDALAKQYLPASRVSKVILLPRAAKDGGAKTSE